MYVSNTRNANFDDLLFYGDQRLISGRQIYRVNDDIVEKLKNYSIIDIYKIKCKKNKSLFRFINLLTIETMHVLTEISKWITYI